MSTPVSTEVVRTVAEQALWLALDTHPGSSAAQLATYAAIGGSTARKILARWAIDGTALRTASSEPRTADLWSAAPADDQPTITEDSAESEPQDDAPAVDEDRDSSVADPAEAQGDGAAETPLARAESTERSTSEQSAVRPDKLAHGALRGQVEDYLRAHPHQELTPHQIGKALERSSGAVHNALMKLAKTGVAEMTSAAPKKFVLTSE